MGSNVNGICILFIVFVHITKVRGSDIENEHKFNGICKEEMVHYRLALNCSGLNLTYVPPTSLVLKGLIFSYNNLTNVTRKTFENISNPGNLVDLELDHNNIRNISSDAFDAFTNLNFLYVSYNPIYYDNMKNMLGRLSSLKVLKHLDMSGMETITIQKDLFSLMKKNNIRTLLLMNCNIEKLDLDILRNFNSLRSLYLRNNRISDLILFQHSNLSYLYLNHNLLKSFPNFSMGGNHSNCYFPNLEILDIRRNGFNNLLPDYLICLPMLTQFKLGSDPIKILPSHLLSQLPRLHVLQLLYLHGGFLKVYPFAFKSKSLVYLYLDLVNGNAQTIFVSLKDSFRDMPSLKTLRLRQISMYQLTNEEVSTLFAPLKTLRSFQCYNCDISQDPKIFLNQMTDLENISFRSNLITTLSADTFAANKQLKYINLRYNEIQHIDVSSFPSALRNQLQQLDFSQNPFVCDCKLEWFIKWMKEIAKKKVLLRYPQEYRCLLPKEKFKIQLSDISFTYKECHPWSPWIWVAIITSPCVLVIGFTVLVLYRNRWNIKHYIYLLRKRKNYQIIDGQNLVFDAFIGYESEDSAFVRRRLLPVLEDEFGLKLCIHERDFQPGVFINDNIVTNMDLSARVILVLSNAFARSSWCMFELKIAHSKQIEDETELVVILLEKVDGRNMNKALKCLLETTTYIEWTEDLVGQELFWTKLKTILKK